MDFTNVLPIIGFLVVALPGLPISIPLLAWLAKSSGPTHGTSGALGGALVVCLASGLIGWLVVIAFLIGHFCFR